MQAAAGGSLKGRTAGSAVRTRPRRRAISIRPVIASTCGWPVLAIHVVAIQSQKRPEDLLESRPGFLFGAGLNKALPPKTGAIKCNVVIEGHPRD
jgi:hypothetical protein